MIWNKAMAFDPKNYCTDPAHQVEGPFGAHEHLGMPDSEDEHLITSIRQFDPVAVVAILPKTSRSIDTRRY